MKMQAGESCFMSVPEVKTFWVVGGKGENEKTWER